jgi:hypothetical protein
LAVNEHARQFRHFADPAAVFFEFTFNVEVHG